MRVAIIGRTETLYETIELLRSKNHEVVCILTAKEAPEYKRTALDFKNLAEQLRIPFAQGSKITDYHDFLKEVDADIAISINYSGIIPQSVINLFPLGILNAHGGDLPLYRGNACQAWAILNGEKCVGLCIHKMIGGELDSGDIIAREYLPIDSQTKVTRIMEWMADKIPSLMLKSLELLAGNPSYYIERQSKNPKEALRCYPRRPEDGRIFWSNSATDLLRLINASNRPYAGAFCQYDEEKIVIWDAEVVEDQERFCAVPGQVTKIGDDYVEVSCGSSKLRLLSIEYKGELIVPSSLIRSIRKRLH
jgi:UDP-4-amino-4-deoxy-L-arabinose formyltransferase/UDP-glucuronic acid dehydrogenase (UDP-4-keto-hexauronic acid decarboxylating)